MPTPEVSASEVEQLLATVASPAALNPAASPLPMPGQGSSDTQMYDFRNPMLLGPRELRKLRSQQEEFASALAARLSLYLRLEVSFKLAGLHTIPYERLAESWANPTHLTLFKLEPLRGIAILEVPPRLGLSLVDRLMGGPGQAPDPVPEITDLERALLEQVVQIILSEWCSHWSATKELKPVVLGHENNGRFVQTAPAETIMLVLSLEVKMGQSTDRIQMGLPFVPLEAMIRQMTQGADALADAAAPAARPVPTWKPAYEDICVPLTAEWQGLELSVAEVLALKPGDVVKLDAMSSQQIILRVGELPRFQGRSGTIAGKWAVELTRAINNQPPT
jgi:flagellar motor switch protein FliM